MVLNGKDDWNWQFVGEVEWGYLQINKNNEIIKGKKDRQEPFILLITT